MEGNKVLLTREVYPDLDNTDYKGILSQYGISIKFLFADGIMITYADNLEAYKTSEDSVSFYDTRTKEMVIQYVEDFGFIRFSGPGYKEILSIPIVENDVFRILPDEPVIKEEEEDDTELG